MNTKTEAAALALEDKTFDEAETALIETIRVIPEAKIKRFKKAFAAYQNTGGEFEDLEPTLIAAYETLIFGYESEAAERAVEADKNNP